MTPLQIMGSATANEIFVEVGDQHSHRYVAKTRKQQTLRIVECLVEGAIHRLFDQAAR
jgi:hypothetical protein